MHRLHPYPDVQVMFRRLLIATLIGLLAALAVALFRHAMVVLETLFLGNDSGSLVNAAQSLPAWRRLITPALGGLAAGALLWLWQRRRVARPHAATDYMEALETGDGCFDTPASLVKSLASLLVVVSGSAIGREGAMILLAALAASLFARRFTPQAEWKLWVACGAAAGMASAYHAPLAGSLFIAEILFGTLMLASLGPVVISAVIALLLTQFLNGGAAPLYHVVLQQDLSALHYGLMLATGLLAGLCGPLFIWLMEYSHRGFVRLKLAPAVAAGAGWSDRRRLIAHHSGGVGQRLQRGAKLSAAAAARRAAGGGIPVQTAGSAGQQWLRRAGRGVYPHAVCRPGDGHAIGPLQRAVATGGAGDGYDDGTDRHGGVSCRHYPCANHVDSDDL